MSQGFIEMVGLVAEGWRFDPRSPQQVSGGVRVKATTPLGFRTTRWFADLDLDPGKWPPGAEGPEQKPAAVQLDLF